MAVKRLPADSLRPEPCARAGFAAAQRPALALAFHSTRLAGAKELLAAWSFVTPIARGCDQLVFVSEFPSRHWLRRGLRARRNAVIHNAVADKRFAPSVRTQWRAATRATLGLGRCRLRPGLLCAAAAGKKKPRAADRRRHRAAPRGDRGACTDSSARDLNGPVIERYAHARSASPWCQPGRAIRTRSEQYIAAFDVGVLCSVAHETFSLAALEQMSMGVPVVLSDQGGAREMVNDGVHGFVVPTGDTPALVDALRRLHPLDARARMGASGGRAGRDLLPARPHGRSLRGAVRVAPARRRARLHPGSGRFRSARRSGSVSTTSWNGSWLPV